MSTAVEEKKKAVGLSKEQYDIVTNQIAVALARNEAIVAGWIANSSRANERRKTVEELKAEDAILFRPQPPRLGLGAPIPAEYLKNEGESTKDLRSRLMPSKMLKASKARDAEEKAASAKRGLRDQSSDEEEGRSSLGRKKKQKVMLSIVDDVNKGVRKSKLVDGEGKDADNTNLTKEKVSVIPKQNKALLVQQDEPKDGEKQSKRSKKQRQRDRKNKAAADELLRIDPDQPPMLSDRPRAIGYSAIASGEMENDVEMEDIGEAAGTEEQERLRKKELKKEQKRRRKKEKKEQKRAGNKPAGLS